MSEVGRDRPERGFPCWRLRFIYSMGRHQNDGDNIIQPPKGATLSACSCKQLPTLVLENTIYFKSGPVRRAVGERQHPGV